MLLYAAHNQPVKFTLTGGHHIKYSGWMLKRSGLILWTQTTFVAMHAKINSKGKQNIMLQGINWLSAGVRMDSYSTYKALCNWWRFYFYEDMK